MAANGVVHVEGDNGPELAWTCGCGEEKDDTEYVVKWDTPIDGIWYGVCHESCLQKVEDDE